MTVVDIVLPYYGDVGLMQQSVRSVLAQRDPRWRLTVVDDGQEAGVPEWFAALGDPRVRYRRNERNLGITGNFQRCLDLVEHDYLVMMGCDDIMLPNYLSTVLSLLERHPEASIIEPGVQIIDGAGRPARTLVDQAKQHVYGRWPRRAVVRQGEELAVSLLRGNWLYFPSLLWRSAALRSVGFDQRLSVIQDLAAVLRLLEQGARVVIAGERAFQYRRHAVSVSSAQAIRGERFAEERAFFAEAARRLDARGWHRAAKAARWHVSSRLHALTLLPAAARRRDRRGAEVLLRHAFAPLR